MRAGLPTVTRRGDRDPSPTLERPMVRRRLPMYATIAAMAHERPALARHYTGWPCCVLVAEVILRVTHRDLDEWMRKPWWGKMMVRDRRRFPYSPATGAGEIVAADVPGSHGRPLMVDRPKPHQIQELCDLMTSAPGWWVVQGWGRDRHGVDYGHTFFVHITPTGEVRGVESSKRWGLRVARKAWIGGELPPTEDLYRRLDEYTLGMGIRRLWGGL